MTKFHHPFITLNPSLDKEPLLPATSHFRDESLHRFDDEQVIGADLLEVLHVVGAALRPGGLAGDAARRRHDEALRVARRRRFRAVVPHSETSVAKQREQTRELQLELARKKWKNSIHDPEAGSMLKTLLKIVAKESKLS